MFALRGVAVSLTFFVLIYCFLSALISVSWRWLRWINTTERSLADLFFLLRILPLFASVVITFTFVVPSFQLLEPRSTDEGTGIAPLAFGIAALLLIAFGCYRVITAQAQSSRIVARWIEGSQPLCKTAGTFAFRARQEAPPLTLVGMRSPRVFVSGSTLKLLTQDELAIALRHELAHIRSFDNLKKLVFRFCPFPGMGKLETAWSHASELAADDAAVSNMREAVDLAGALVKLSRLVSVDAAPACTVGFVTGSLSARVARLLAWEENRKLRRLCIPRWAAIPPLFAAVFCAFMTYGPVLAWTHEATEWLVR
ncbi:MAG: M56 family metallopeptidase [Terriglobales bacterium]